VNRLALALSMLASLAGPPASGQSVRMGLVAGRSSAWQSGTLAYSGSRNAVTAGIRLARGVTGGIAVQLDVLYSEAGAGTSPDLLHVDYITAPLLVKLTPLPHARLQPVALGGVAPAVEVGCTATYYSGNPADSSQGAPVACASRRSRYTDWGLVVGGGVELIVRGVTLSATARYTHGIVNLASGIGPQTPPPSLYNRSVSVCLAAVFGPSE